MRGLLQIHQGQGQKREEKPIGTHGGVAEVDPWGVDLDFAAGSGAFLQAVFLTNSVEKRLAPRIHFCYYIQKQHTCMNYPHEKSVRSLEHQKI